MEYVRNWLLPLTGAAGSSMPSGTRPPTTPGGLPPGKVMFRPQPFWQKLRAEHVAVAGIEFRLGMDDGCNYAKLSTKADIDADGEYARGATKLVPQGKGDTETLSAILREAAGTGDVVEVRSILLSCFVTFEAAEPAVCEAAKHNHAACLELLLDAGASPSSTFSSKPALHFAMLNGAEDCARLLIDRLPDDEIHVQDPRGHSAFEAAANADLSSLSRRMLEYASERGSTPAK